MYLYIYIYICTYIHIYICIYIHIYTYELSISAYEKRVWFGSSELSTSAHAGASEDANVVACVYVHV